ncbi:MAG: mannose-1-phosphate guanylyltransferase [Deinococcota bacterium]|jgi:mannose-1-phosphate guanylyltransferase|nr:mannose-1-phosphate guanylyltransferase [Deinococcota bacterium]
MDDLFIPVIMAGGSGQRFWPLSTAERPKQFLDLEHSGRSLLQATFDRLLPLAGGAECVFVVTCERYRGLILEQLPELPAENLILEPVARDTAAAVALAALEVEARFGNVVMGLFSSDHRIGDVGGFQATVRQAAEATLATAGLVTLGIRPTFAATGYGYIQRGEEVGGGVYRVARFVEKPDLERARSYLGAGDYSWNGGIFLWHTKTILDELANHVPELMTPLREALATGTLDSVFPTLPKTSIDYAVLERTERAFVVPADFGWDDLGDWIALERLLKQDAPNTVIGRHVSVDTSGSLIYTTDGEDVIITIGLEDLVIVKEGKRMLIARKDRVQDIKGALQGPELAEG